MSFQFGSQMNIRGRDNSQIDKGGRGHGVKFKKKPCLKTFQIYKIDFKCLKHM